MTETGYAEKIQSINFGGIKKGTTPKQNDDIVFKKKLEGDLADKVKSGDISTATADAQGAIAGICKE